MEAPTSSKEQDTQTLPSTKTEHSRCPRCHGSPTLVACCSCLHQDNSNSNDTNHKRPNKSTISPAKQNPGFPQASNIPFPYPTPYPQQVDLMHALLETLRLKEQGQVEKETHSYNAKKKHDLASIMFLESPTGTGKSLSLASAALAWLQYRDQQDLAVATEIENTSPEATSSPKPAPKSSWLDAWVPPEQKRAQQEDQERRQSAERARTQLQKVLAQIRQRNQASSRSNRVKQRQRVLLDELATVRSPTHVPPSKKPAKSVSKNNKAKMTSTTNSDDLFCLEDYQSDPDTTSQDNEKEDIGTSKSRQSHRPLSQSAKLLRGSSLDGSQRPAGGCPTLTTTTESKTVGNVVPGSGVRKIVYAARTHSQLSQFVHELDKLREQGHYVDVRVLALGGRSALCGHKALAGKAEAVVNETCLDWQQGKKSCTTASTAVSVTNSKKRSASTGSKSGCPLLSNQAAVDALALHLLAEPTDIEDAAALGKSSQACSYYASRTALAAAQVVVLPYTMLLSRHTRQAIGLHLSGALVLIDEAHNIPEALRQVHSCCLTESVVDLALEQLKWYTDKYVQRLASRNLYYLGQVRKILLALQKALRGKIKAVQDDTLVTGMDLLCSLRLDNTNISKILRYLNESRLPQKLLGFAKHVEQQLQRQQKQNEDDPPSELSKHVSAMAVVQTFLEKLTLTNEEGKFLLTRDTKSSTEQSSFRFVLLQPALFLQNVLDESHAVAMVGGTLQPFGHVAMELLNRQDLITSATLADREIRQKLLGGSCSIISSELTIFSCDHVVSPDNVLLQCWTTGPTGVRLDFRHASRKTEKQCDELGLILGDGICKSVPHGVVVFLPSYSYEALLVQRWKATGVIRPRGNHLMIGNRQLFREPKSSRQIESTLSLYSKEAESNRGAILLSVIGGKMSEGINFANDMARCVCVVGLPYPDITDPILKEKMASMDSTGASSISGKSYYQNLCMRAVNQSVGRAIRHANDYASIILLDHRYETDLRVWAGLPSWLKQGSATGNIQNPTSVPFPNQLEQLRSFFDK